MSQPKVAIVVIHYGSYSDTSGCIESLMEMDFKDYRIVLVDNDPERRGGKRLREAFPGIHLIENSENKGFACGSNDGIGWAMERGFDYIWLLNNDAFVDKSSLSDLVSFAEKNPRVGLLSPVLIDCHDRSEKQFSENTAKYLKQGILFGTAMLIRREVIARIGMLSEKYFMYFEDDEYSLRAIKAGFLTRVVGTSKVCHKGKLLYYPDKPYKSFYTVRNLMFIYGEAYSGADRAYGLFRSLLFSIALLSTFRKEGKKEFFEAVLLGLYCASKNIGGRMDKNIRIPKYFRAVFAFLSHIPNILHLLFDNRFVRRFKIIQKLLDPF